MLIKKPGMGDGGQRQYDPSASLPIDAGGTRPTSSGEVVGGTSALDALRDSLGGAGLLERGHVLQGRYEVEQVLGIGGMSAVYRARDLRFANVIRYCAIKEMPDNAPDQRTGELHLATFEREASLLATLNHPGIPKIYDFFADSGRVYLVLEYIEGHDLESVLEQAGGPLTIEAVVRWCIQVCEVLTYLHRHKPQAIVFRDLKPSNIMISAVTGKAMMIDFGIAKIFQSDKRGTMIGTEGYSPPEQYRGLSDPRVDIYAMGATMHHLLTNSDPRLETPFTFNERMPRELNPSIPMVLEQIIMRCLEYSADARWQTAEELQAELEALLAAHAQPTTNLAATLAGPSWPRVETPAQTPAGQIYQRSGTPPPPLGVPQRQPSGPQAVAPEPTVTTLLWSFGAEDEIRSAALVAKGIVFFGSYDSNMYALNAKGGDFLWKYATEAGICTVPAIYNDLLVFGSEDHSLYGLEASRGAVTWRFRAAGPIRSSPRLAQYAIYFGCDDQHLYCVDARNGAMLWKYATWGPVRSSPAVGKELIYVGSHDGNLHAVDAASGQHKWKFRTLGPITSSPVIYEGLVIFGSADQTIYALDGDNGFAMWKYRTSHYVSSSPTIDAGKVYVGGVDGTLYSLEAQSGKQLWRFDTGNQIISSPRVADGKVYFGTADGQIYCLSAKNGDLRWRFRTGGPITAGPAPDDGMVYVGSFDHKLYALAM